MAIYMFGLVDVSDVEQSLTQFERMAGMVRDTHMTPPTQLFAHFWGGDGPQTL